MSTLKGLLDSAESGSNLVVTGPHYEWLELLEHEQMPSREAMFHVIKVLLRQFKMPRAGRFSPSAMGMCARRIVFGYAGAPQLAPDTGSLEIFDHGTVSHLKWQIEGITMGWMKAGEIWVEDKDLLIGGSTDGELENGDVFELKSAAPSVFNRIVIDQRAPKYENLMQVNTYFLLSGADWASIVYEDRAYGNFHEFRVERDAKIEKEILRRLKSYKGYVEQDELPPMLAPCEERIGSTYKYCPYRKFCPTVSTVSAAEEAGKKVGQEDAGRIIPLGLAMPVWAQELLKFIDAMEVTDASA